MSIEKVRSFVAQVNHLESEIQSSRDRAEALPLTLSQKLRICSEIKTAIETALKQDRGQVNFDFLTDTERDWYTQLIEKPVAVRNQVDTVLSQIQSLLTSDQVLFSNLTPEEHAWIIKKVGSLEVVKQGMNGGEFRGELPLMPLSIIRQYLRRCGGGRFIIKRHSRIDSKDIEFPQEMAQAEDELIDVDEFLNSIRRAC